MTSNVKLDNIQDLSWMAKLTDKEWEIIKKRLPEYMQLSYKEAIKMVKAMEKEFSI